MRIDIAFFLLGLLFAVSPTAASFAQEKTYANLSKRLVKAVHQEQDPTAMLDSLASVPADTLAAELDKDNARKAFWINIYNAQIQYVLGKNPEKFEERPGFFKEELFVVAGENLSFEEVEHGIIRGSQSPIGLGIFPKLFP